MTQMSRNTTVLSFAFSGLLAAPKRAYEAPRPTGPTSPKKR
jgi:hypothetical protein